jgi:hypothetical protein
MCFFLHQVTPSIPDAPPVAASSKLAQALVMKELQEKTEWLAGPWPQSLGKVRVVWAEELPQSNAVL